MANVSQHRWPALHNAMWPGLVGKGSPGAEPAIDLDTMLDLTAKASVDGVRFDGVDLFLFDPHTSIDSTDDDLKRLRDKIVSRRFMVGSLVAPVWPPTGGGSAMGGDEDRRNFLTQVRKACAIGKELRDLGIRRYGVIRIDSACSPTEWSKDPEGNAKRIAETFRQACDIAESYGERLAAEGEICWGGMHSWKRMVQLLETVNRPKTLGFQADMAHTLLYTMGYNAPEDRILPDGYDWSRREELDEALRKVTRALRPWTIDLHIAQNDATVKGSGSHDKTGRHCLPNDPNGKLDVVRHAGFWMCEERSGAGQGAPASEATIVSGAGAPTARTLRGGVAEQGSPRVRDEQGTPTRAFQHICWDGCMFPNATMMQQSTWNDILRTMIDVRNAHGWDAPVMAAAV